MSARGAGEQSAQIQRLLALSPVFSNMDSRNVALLEQLVKTVERQAGTVLFRRGDAGGEFFIILEGEIELFIVREKDGTASEEILETYGPCQAFGELALFGKAPRTLGARTRSGALLCTIGRENLIRLIEAGPCIAVSLLETVSRRMAGIVRQGNRLSAPLFFLVSLYLNP
jgi:CRP-like cAMP-binding protein